MSLPEVPEPLGLPRFPERITRWTHRHPVMEVRETQIDPKLTNGVRTEWRPAGTDDQWLPVNPHDLRRLYVEIPPKKDNDQ